MGPRSQGTCFPPSLPSCLLVSRSPETFYKALTTILKSLFQSLTISSPPPSLPSFPSVSPGCHPLPPGKRQGDDCGRYPPSQRRRLRSNRHRQAQQPAGTWQGILSPLLFPLPSSSGCDLSVTLILFRLSLPSITASVYDRHPPSLCHVCHVVLNILRQATISRVGDGLSTLRLPSTHSPHSSPSSLFTHPCRPL